MKVNSLPSKNRQEEVKKILKLAEDFIELNKDFEPTDLITGIYTYVALSFLDAGKDYLSYCEVMDTIKEEHKQLWKNL